MSRGLRVFVPSASALLTDHRPHGEGLIAWDVFSGKAFGAAGIDDEEVIDSILHVGEYVRSFCLVAELVHEVGEGGLATLRLVLGDPSTDVKVRAGAV